MTNSLKVWASACLLFSAIATLVCAQSNVTPQRRPDLTGHVQLTNGQPANATVFISTAGPRTGTSPFCPSCYADCRKSAPTDSQGNFKIESLDPDLIFRILVVGEGCQPKFVGKVDPAKKPVNVTLKPLDLAGTPADRILRGHITDAKGAVIEGASVETSGIQEKDGGIMWGTIDGVDRLAVTDARGNFVITSRKAFTSLDVDVEARGFANKKFARLGTGQINKLQLTEGAAITGRVVWNGRPLPRVGVGVVSENRDMERFAGHFEIGTDADGKFAFLNLPPNVRYQLYGLMDTLHTRGATKSVLIDAGGDGSTTAAGDLTVGPAWRLTGKIVLDDGKPVPAGTRLMIDREDAWDSLLVIVGKDGSFDVPGIPQGGIGLNVRLPGYRVSARNASLDRLNPFGLKGRVDHDITNLVFLMERGAELEPDYDAGMNMDEKNRPLHGTEGGNEVVRMAAWKISGHVKDAATRQPITSFKVTPGSQEYSQIHLSRADEITGRNGLYAIAVDKHTINAILRIDAAGYLPVVTAAPEEDRTNFDLTLQPGTGPAGTVLLPNGKPAAKARVGLICAGNQEMALIGDKLESWREKNLISTADAAGYFSFAPEPDMQKVAAASPEGFKIVDMAELATNSQIVLEPWGIVTGTLLRPGGPGTNEDLDLSFSPAALNLNAHAITDAQGRFEFEHVPPGALNVTYRVKMSERGWQNEPLRKVTVAPGKTVDIRIDGGERVTNGNISFGQPAKPPARRGPPISGIVLLPNGRPASGAEVAVAAPNEYLSLGRATFEVGADKSIKTTTDDSGHFTLPGIERATSIVAVSDDGYARWPLVSGGAAPQLTLQPWGKISGILRIGNQVGSNQWVTLGQGDAPDVFLQAFRAFRTKTDQDGRFSINYIPPGEQSVCRSLTVGGNSWITGNPTLVDVKPGGVTSVTLGGTGRAVVGKAVPNQTLTPDDWKNVRIRLGKAFSPKKSMSPQETQAWWKSKEGQEAHRRSRNYLPEQLQDGIFRFEDVEPGNYQLSISMDHSKFGLHSTSYVIAPLASTNIIVVAGNKDRAVDIGSIDFKIRP